MAKVILAVDDAAIMRRMVSFTLGGAGHEVLEGPEVEGVVILEFPSFDEAKAWYDSPAYREVREHRFRGADYRAVIVEGI